MTNPKQILLVEDDPNDIELTLTAFEQHGFRVHGEAVDVSGENLVVVRDGQQALDFLLRQGEFQTRTSGNPAVVLLDLKIPKIDGLEVLRRVRAEEDLRLIPIVMLTSSREEQDVATSYRNGVNAYVVKPVGFAEYTTALKHVEIFWTAINEPPIG